MNERLSVEWTFYDRQSNQTHALHNTQHTLTSDHIGRATVISCSHDYLPKNLLNSIGFVECFISCEMCWSTFIIHFRIQNTVDNEFIQKKIYFFSIFLNFYIP